MADKSSIEWTDATWNPVTGCSRVSAGCENCYAERLAATRMKHHPSRQGLTDRHGRWNGEVRFNWQWLDQPLRWQRPRRIFVCAHGDLFHESVPDGWIMRVLDVMFRCPLHVFQVLTKRPERMLDFMKKWGDLGGESGWPKLVRGPDETRKAHPSGRGQLFASYLDALLEESGGKIPEGAAFPTFDWMGGMIGWPLYPPNVWLGVSAEDQRTADSRIPVLLETPAAVRWLSAEPLLGPIEIDDFLWPAKGDRPALDWVVAGGESGPGARPMDPSWPRSLRNQCICARVPYFFKQWGGATSKAGGCQLDGRTWQQMPERRA